MKVGTRLSIATIFVPVATFLAATQPAAADQSPAPIDASHMLKGLDLETGSYRDEIGEPMTHNGSTMWLFRKSGYIVYNDPKPSIVGTVKTGTILFKGAFTGRSASGEAYVFKAGCAPAAYHVIGVHVGRVDVTLAGQAPVRKRDSCEIAGYAVGKNSTLVFIGNHEFAD